MQRKYASNFECKKKKKAVDPFDVAMCTFFYLRARSLQRCTVALFYATVKTIVFSRALGENIMKI